MCSAGNKASTLQAGRRDQECLLNIIKKRNIRRTDAVGTDHYGCQVGGKMEASRCVCAEQAALDESTQHRQTTAASSRHLLVSFLSSGRSKGYWPKSMTYSITPLLQMSAFTPS